MNNFHKTTDRETEVLDNCCINWWKRCSTGLLTPRHLDLKQGRIQGGSWGRQTPPPLPLNYEKKKGSKGRQRQS